MTSQIDVVVPFLNQCFGDVCWQNMHIFLCIHSSYFMCHCTEYKLSALQVRLSEENATNATTQQFVTANVSGCALKERSTTHSSIHQSNLQLQDEAALMSCRIWAVEHRKCAAGLAGTHSGLQDRIWLNYTRWRMRIKYARKLSIFLLFIEVQHTFSFPFSCWDTLNASMLLC